MFYENKNEKFYLASFRNLNGLNQQIRLGYFIQFKWVKMWNICNHKLRTYATKYFPYLNIFNTLHIVCFMGGLSIYEIKRICHRDYLFIISSWRFQHLTNFLNRWKNNTRPKYQAKIVVIFSQLLSINLNYCPWPQTFLENLIVYLLPQALIRYCMLYFGNSSKIGVYF